MYKKLWYGVPVCREPELKLYCGIGSGSSQKFRLLAAQAQQHFIFSNFLSSSFFPLHLVSERSISPNINLSTLDLKEQMLN